MYRKTVMYTVTGRSEDKEFRMKVECLETEDPIVMAFRMSPEMRKFNTIRVTFEGAHRRRIMEFPQITREDIQRDEGPKVDSIWSYVDARNRWSDER